MTTVVCSSSIKTEERSRLSFASVERHTLQLQAMTGTPWEVPVPRKVTFKVAPPVL